METFKIKISKQLPPYEGNVNIEFIPDECPGYEDKALVSDFVPETEVSDPAFVDSKRIILYSILEDLYGTEFTEQYEL
jgi:hypothetical protein